MVEEHVLDLLPGYALGILDAEDLLKVSRHLPQCATCRKELSTYTQTVDQLALAAPLRTPPPDLRARVIRRVAGNAATEPMVKSLPRQAGPPHETKRLGLFDWLSSLISPRLGWALGALAVILLLFLTINNVLLWQRINALQAQAPGGTAHIVNLAGTQNAPQATGYVLVFEGNNYGTLTVDNAPQLEANQQYQIWLIKDGKRTSGGVFDVSDEGYGVLEIVANQPLMNYQSFGITIEPKGGSPAPTGKKVLGGGL